MKFKIFPPTYIFYSPTSRLCPHFPTILEAQMSANWTRFVLGKKTRQPQNLCSVGSNSDVCVLVARVSGKQEVWKREQKAESRRWRHARTFGGFYVTVYRFFLVMNKKMRREISLLESWNCFSFIYFFIIINIPLSNKIGFFVEHNNLVCNLLSAAEMLGDFGNLSFNYSFIDTERSTF